MVADSAASRLTRLPLLCVDGSSLPVRLSASVLSRRASPFFSQPFQPTLLVLEFLWEFVPTILRAVLLVLFFIDFGYFVEDCLSLFIDLLSRLILFERGIALDTSAIKRDFAHLCHPSLSTQTNNLDEKMLKVLAMGLAKIADGAEIRLLIGCKIAKSNITFQQTVDFPRTMKALCVGEGEDFEQHNRMKLRSISVFVSFLWVEWVQPILFIKVVNGVGDESFETVVFDPLREILRKEVLLILIVSDEIGCNDCSLTQ